MVILVEQMWSIIPRRTQSRREPILSFDPNAMSLRTELFERIKRGPAWVQEPLRAAWHLWRRIENALWSLAVFPRMLLRLKSERRILGIYHFQEHAGFLGDMVEFLAVLNVLRVENGLAKVDLCYIDDPTNPNRPISRDRLETSADFKPMMLELRTLLPSTGAVLQFDSDAGFEAFFRSHYHRYESWPQYGYLHSWPSHVDYGDVSSRGFAFPNVFAPLHRFFAANGWLPQLTCPPALLEWARSFIRQHVSPAVPVAAQIRFNPESPARNTDIEAWKAFFQAMEKRSEVKFIVVCRREEIVPELRSLTNVVYSKDHASSVLEDLALIQVSEFSMFPDAGFPAYPWFCGQPTLFFGKQLHEFPQRRLGDETGTRMPFLSPFQRRRFGPYTAATLEEEFWKLWNDLAAANWKNPHLG